MPNLARSGLGARRARRRTPVATVARPGGRQGGMVSPPRRMPIDRRRLYEVVAVRQVEHAEQQRGADPTGEGRPGQDGRDPERGRDLPFARCLVALEPPQGPPQFTDAEYDHEAD